MEEYKIKVQVQPMDGQSIWDCDSFTCELYVTRERSVIFNKGDTNRVMRVSEDNNDQIKLIVNKEDAQKIGYGVVKLKMTALVPDTDFEDGYRTEIIDNVCTGVVIRSHVFL